MKVKELIEMLKREDGDLEAHLAYDYGDHCHTTVTPKVEWVDTYLVKWSDYHQMDGMIDDGGDEGKLVVVIR